MPFGPLTKSFQCGTPISSPLLFLAILLSNVTEDSTCCHSPLTTTPMSLHMLLSLPGRFIPLCLPGNFRLILKAQFSHPVTLPRHQSAVR